MDILGERYILIDIKENNPMKCNVFFNKPPCWSMWENENRQHDWLVS